MKVYEYKGSWYYRFDNGIHPVTGKRWRPKEGGFKSEKEAFKAGIKAKAEIEMGLGTPSEKITFGEMAKIWLEEYKNRGNVKDSSVFAREHCLKHWVKRFEQIQIRKINMTMIQAGLNELRNQYKESTLINLLSALKMVFKKARQLGYVNTNPTEFVFVPKKKKTVEEIETAPIETRYLEKDVLKRFLDIANDYGNDHDKIMFRLLAYTGMRVGECLALKWSDIDFDNHSIKISRRILHHTFNVRVYELDTPKTNSSIRVIPVDKKMILLLKELQTYQHWFKLKNKDYNELNFVFVCYKKKGDTKGYPPTRMDVRRRIARIARMAKINQAVTPHTFRHTHTSLMAEAGVDLATIMERLGHKNDSITKDIYLHITKSLKTEAVHKFEKLMNDTI